MKYNITIGWLYPELMSTYGDRGNILVLQKRAQWRGIEVKILPISFTTPLSSINKIDLLFGGGAQDKEQEILISDLRDKKGTTIKNLIEKNIPSLFVCGSPQLMGNFYEPAVGKRIKGLGIFNVDTIHPENENHRLIGNIIGKIQIPELKNELVVGFENHGGRSYLKDSTLPFAKVIKGFGNNGHDKTEGMIYKNAIGCYFHGPLLPKNPKIADFLLKKALEVKYNKKITLDELDDFLESKAQKAIANKLGTAL